MVNRTLRAVGVTIAILALGMFQGPKPAVAGSATASLSVTASITQNCIIATGTLPFGAYDPVVANRTAALNASTTMAVTCTKGATGITMGLGASANTANCPSPAGQRCLASGSNYLNYNLYASNPNPTPGTVWTTAISESVTGGITTPTNVTIYGQIPAGQDVAVGASYTDTVVATVNY